MISREQVADLLPGDVVELTSTTWPNGAVRGPLRHNEEYGALILNSPCGEETYVIRNAQGAPSCADQRALTVVSRAPRPLYVNHPRTEPVSGDVVRDAESDSPNVWFCADPDDGSYPWMNKDAQWQHRDDLPARLRLLVDGETGMTVPE